MRPDARGWMLRRGWTAVWQRLRELRAQITAAETEQQRLRVQEAELDARIAALEARLDTWTRQLLGIGN